MTTVEFGGGPTLEARRRFINLKGGGEIPRYAGHVHQLRFHQGHTYTEETHRVSEELPFVLKRSKTQIPVGTYDESDPYETRNFPDGMIPGYAGYIPQRKFQHGNRYRIETDACSISTRSSYEDGKQKTRRLNKIIDSYPKTDRLNSGTVVKHFLDYHRAHHPNESSLQDDRRSFIEAPIPGYKGYIPRMIPIGVGVGSRYHDATQQSLHRFAAETTHSTTNLSASTDNNQSNLSAHQRPITMPATHRIYQRSGMIPRYTGYLPQRKYRVGQTFGDTTRELPVCNHMSSSYGDIARSNSFIQGNSTNNF